MFEMTDEQILKIADYAKMCMINTFGNNELILSIKVVCFSLENVEDVCKKLAPLYMDDPVFHDTAFFRTIRAEAFPGSTNHVLIRSDLNASEGNQLHVLLNAMCHILTFYREYGGQSFFDHFCRDQRCDDDGEVYSGYSVWREFIAEFMACLADPNCQESVRLNRKLLKNNLGSMFFSFDSKTKTISHVVDAKKALHDVLIDIFTSSDYFDSITADHLCSLIKVPFLDEIVHIVFDQLRKPDCMAITPDFVRELGKAFMTATFANSTIRL
jgi:hypothetical protein